MTLPAEPIVVEICARSFVLPAECPCCGSDADAETTVSLKPTRRHTAADSARQVGFPCCRRCLEHVAVADAASMQTAFVFLAGMVIGVVSGIVIDVQKGVFAFLCAVPVMWVLGSLGQRRAQSRCGPSCSTTRSAVTYLGWSGSTSAFSFASPTYTARFAEHNLERLVSVTGRVRALLEAHRVARAQVPTPAMASCHVPPPRTHAEWIERLQRVSGTVARRMALQRALAGSDVQHHRDLVDAVCRVELEPVLRSRERLAAPGWRRELLQTLATVRADNIPAELRDAEVRVIEAALEIASDATPP